MRLLGLVILLSSFQIGLTQNKSYTVGYSVSSELPFTNTNYSSPFVKHDTGDQINNNIVFKMSYDSLNLYLAYYVSDSIIEANQTQHDSPIYKTDDCVELFLDFDGDGKNYLELGINPNGVYYDYLIYCNKAKCGKWESDPNYSLDSISISTIIKSDDSDNNEDLILSYSVYVTIPFKSLENLRKYGYATPSTGTVWKANLFCINPTLKQFNSWSPTKSFGFHQPDFFGEVIFN